MKVKKLVGILAIFMMAVGLLAGCGSNTTDNSKNNSTKKETVDAAEGVAETKETLEADANGKILIVYYSASGMTEAVAKTIADTLDADLFEIIPLESYSDDDLDWANNYSRVSKEHDDESLRNVKLTSVVPENWDSYDIVFIVYPIWWGIAAWPVDNFVKGNDFSGKTVIPFCTSASSDLGNSGNLLEEMAGTGEWQKGQRFRSGDSDSDIQQWVESLNLNK